MDQKHALLSKTIWVNMVMAIMAFVAIWFPAAKEIVTPENLMLVFSVINIILRAVTKGAIFLKE